MISAKDLNFNWRMGDYALEATPKRLARFSKDEPNETIDFVKYYQRGDKEFKYSIGYFWYNDHEPCWELKFVGERFREILDTDTVAVFTMLVAAYDVLEEWSRGKKHEN